MSQDLQETYIKLDEERRKYSYDLTQRLTYFVITAELALCGYMLLNAKQLTEIQGGAYLFLVCGIASLTGILWRFCYNTTYYMDTHYELKSQYHKTKIYRYTQYWQSKLHNIYVILTLITFVWLLGAGYIYLSNVKA